MIRVTMFTLFLMTALLYGVQVKAAPEPIKIGVVGPKGWIQWDGLWEGAQMARDEINADGGILGNPIELIEIDSHAAPTPDPTAGIAEMITALDDGAQFLVGGFRSECVFPMREAAMDYARDYGRPIWFISGSSTTELIDCGYFPGHPYACGKCVRCDYNRYRYMFRVTPMSSTKLFEQFAAFLRVHLLGYYPTMANLTISTPGKLARMYGSPVKTYIVAENLVWTDLMIAALTGTPPPGVPPEAWYPAPPHPAAVLGNHSIIVGVARPSPIAETFDTEFADIDAKGARLIIHIFSAVAGANFIKQWGTLEANAVAVGINVESQMQEFYDSVAGKCEYEAFLASVGSAPVTPLVPGATDKFWDDYHARWGHYPIYTAWGAYDSIKAINETITAAGTWPMTCDEMIPMFEKTDRQSLLGQFKYTGPEIINMTEHVGYPWYIVAPVIHEGASTPEDALSAAKAVYATIFDPGGINPDMKGTLHDVFCDPYYLTPYWPEPRYVRALIVQWQASSSAYMKVVWPQDQIYSRRYKIPPWMYELSDFDINYDGKVNIVDISTAAAAFGSHPGHPRWNLEVDINGDGKVNILDIAIIASNFGKTAPQWPLP